jgi:hypothetical protein
LCEKKFALSEVYRALAVSQHFSQQMFFTVSSSENKAAYYCQLYNRALLGLTGNLSIALFAVCVCASSGKDGCHYIEIEKLYQHTHTWDDLDRVW